MIAKSLARPLILATDLGGSPDRRLCLRCARRIAPRSSSVRFRIASRSCGTRSSSALLVCPKSRLLATGENGACLVPWYVKCTTHTARGLRSTRYKGATCRGLHSAWAVVCKEVDHEALAVSCGSIISHVGDSFHIFKMVILT